MSSVTIISVNYNQQHGNHKEPVTVGKESPIKAYFVHRHGMLFVRKNMSSLKTLASNVYYLLISSARTISKCYRNDRNDLIPWVVKAIMWNLTNSKNSKFLGYKTTEA